MLDYLVELWVSIPGPAFLVYFIILSAIVAAIAWIWSRKDNTTYMAIPSENALNWTEIAVVRGDRNAVLHVAVFDLWWNKFIEFTSTPKIKIADKAGDASGLGIIQRAALDFINSGSSVYPGEIFTDVGLRSKLDALLSTIYPKLERMHLVRGQEEFARAWKAFIVCLGFLLLVGGSKLFLGIVRNKPSIYLMLLLIVDIILIWKIAKPTSRLPTNLGRKYLKIMEEKLSWMKNQLETNNKETVNPDLLIAVYGVGILTGADYKEFNDSFKKANSLGSGGCGGGCGYSSGSSGCGGGGGCGGGCGGCGGCGG